MRCMVRNAGALLAMVWSGAAAALAGPVNIRTTVESLNPAALVRWDRRTLGEAEPLADSASLATGLGEPPLADASFPNWLPERLTLTRAVPTPAEQVRPEAVVIPLPAPIWLGVAGLGCAVFVARVLNPCAAAMRWRPLR